MNRNLLLLAVGFALVGLGATNPSAQSRPIARPDFTGKWTSVATPGVIADAPLFAEGVITQDASSITFASGDRSLTYRLDAPESKNTQTSVRGETITLVSQVRWVTNALVITTRHNRGTTEGWEDLWAFSLNGRGELNVARVVAVTSPEPVMKTSVLTYKRH
jgi:hypothetical protein